jgi:molybdenum cofactor synthesis domain-containing protein
MNKQVSVQSLNISVKKGTTKIPGQHAIFSSLGVEGDAHAGSWHRQVSMLGVESIKKQEDRLGRPLGFGEFAENITTEGMQLHKTRPLDRFESNGLVLEVTQIGKKCHGEGCIIFKETGNCVMPKEGIFCRVISGGELNVGDVMTYVQKTFKVKVITLSDRAHAGVYSDRSGDYLIQELGNWFNKTEWNNEVTKVILPDDSDGFNRELEQSISEKTDLIISTGSTGIGSRDIAPRIIQDHLDMELPGIMEMVRIKYGSENPRALLSRSIAGVAGKTLLFGLPGSTKAVKEYLQEILKILQHTVYMIHDIDDH